MTSLFAQINNAVNACHGWSTPLKCQIYASTVIALRPNNSVVIGVFGGRDVFAIALAHRQIGKGSVMAIDPWSQTASIEGQSGENADWWGKCDHESVYQDFQTKLSALDVGGVVSVRREKSDAVIPPAQIDLLVIDGNHGPQAQRDVTRFASKVRIGGIVFLDDEGWVGGHVANAGKLLREMGFEKLYAVDTTGAYQRMK